MDITDIHIYIYVYVKTYIYIYLYLYMYIYIYMYVYGPSLSLLHSSTCWSPGKPSWPCPGLLAASPLYPGKARGNRQYKQTVQNIIENDHRAKSLVNHCWPNCYTNCRLDSEQRWDSKHHCDVASSTSFCRILFHENINVEDWPIAYCLLPTA